MGFAYAGLEQRTGPRLPAELRGRQATVEPIS